MQTQQTVHPDLLSNLDYHLVRAETGKRFLNYVIDLFLFYILVTGVYIVINLTSASGLNALEDDSIDNPLIDRLFFIICYAVYMFIIEAVFKGKSLGKLITRTRAVNLDGSNISVSTALARGFSRAVPFCVFSAFGTPCNPWQDRWTDTMVIDEKHSHLLDPVAA
jgi:uncharacterized RDD family membrane protein YckC